MPKFTPTENRLLQIFSDGCRHTKADLRDQLSDGDLNGVKALSTAISRLRKKLRPIGEDVICELHHRKIHYRHVRLLGSSSE